VPKTLLAVDDSVTMRKVLEITFGGEDYRIVTADSAQSALGKLGENPSVVVIDTALGSDDGYALSKEIRKRDASATIVLLSSRHNPYDPAKGKDAGADDFMDKPFDTQQMVDKVKKALVAREAGASSTQTFIGHTPAGAPAPAAQSPAPAPVAARPPPAAPAPPPQAAVARPPAPAAAPVVARANTLMFGTQEAAKAGAPMAAPAPPTATQVSRGAPPPAPPPPAAAAPRPTAVAAQPAPSPQPPKAAPAPAHAAPAHPPPAHAAASGAVAGKVNGQLAGKLGELGLSPQQVEGVLALSREVVEQVVWEVVPQLAETLIKEEIARLMKP